MHPDRGVVAVERNARRSPLVAAALCALLHGAVPVHAQEPVVSAGGHLVERLVLDRTLVARRDLEVFRRPERELLFPMFWKPPVPAGRVARGETVCVIGVGETYLWRDRLVWLHLRRRSGAGDSVWFRIGPQAWASSAVWRHWVKLPVTGGQDVFPTC